MSPQVATIQREQRLLKELDQVRAGLQTVGDQCMRCADWGSNIADQANHVVELSTNGALRRLYLHRLTQLEQAWARCRSGQYGVCESCGSQIDPDRLKALPDTTLCVRCRRQRERQR